MDCPNCGTSNPSQARFCLNCGAALAPGQAAPREERKVVSVLFADLVGFTSRAEQLDPEDVERILRPYHARLRTDIERYAGTVEKFIGDAVMAVFGAPTTHEDDAERAVRAALAIRDWARETDGVELRVAVNSGEALVNVDARPDLGQAIVKGDVVNTAARLQSAAPVNGVLVGEGTYRATGNAIEYTPAEPVVAKGKSEPIRVWEATQARSSVGVDVRQVGRGPLVGRQRELDALVDALHRARSTLQPQLVTLVGVPGIGKSRLLWELFQIADAEKDLTLWRQGRSLPYGAGVAFWAVGEMVKSQAGILENDEPATALTKLDASVADLLGEEEQRGWVAGHLRPLVGIGSTETVSVTAGEVFAAWRRYMEALAERHPLVLVFEDLHWADDGTLDFVDYLAEWATGIPLLLIGTARPELLARRPNWGGGKTNALTLSISPLTDAETAELVHSLFDKPVLAAEMQRALLEQAGGNPLYAEEFVRLAQESGVGSQLPENVQAIIAARIDALAFDEKRLLQRASILGKVFWLGGLAAVADDRRWTVEETLHRLDRREFVRRERRSSVAAETEYAFRHALVRDVAYEQLPRGDRAQLHERAAKWLESLGRTEDTAEMLAYHYLAALEYGRAAGRSVEHLENAAGAALASAGERALALNSFATAANHFAAALELTPPDSRDRPSLMFGLARSKHGGPRAEAVAALSAASEALASSGDLARAAVAEVMIAELSWHSGDRPATNQHLGRAEEFIREVGATPARARVLSEIARYAMLADREEDAVVIGEQAIALARQLNLPVVEAHALDTVGMARFSHGDPEGIKLVESSLELALAADSPEASRSLNNLSVATFIAGDARRAYELRRDSIAVDRKFGRDLMARFAEAGLLIHTYVDGDWDKFLEQAEQYALESARSGVNYSEIYLLGLAARIYVARGADADALAAAQTAVDRARPINESQVLMPALSAKAWVDFVVGDHDGARAAIAELARAPRNTMLLDLIALSTGAKTLGIEDLIRQIIPRDAPASTWIDVVRAILGEDLVRAGDLLQAAGHVPDAALVRTEAADRLARAGRHGEADALIRQALPFWRSVRATRYIKRSESLLSRTA